MTLMTVVVVQGQIFAFNRFYLCLFMYTVGVVYIYIYIYIYIYVYIMIYIAY